jgi:alpha-1,6-mannosyltransferase
MILVLYAACFVPYLLMVRGRICWRWALATGLLARLMLVPLDPLLSDDLWRYVWDGRVALAGVNPFAYAPDAPQLAALRDGHIWPRVNHPEVPTIYPPAAQLLFLLNAALGGAEHTLRALFIAVELGCLAIAARHLPETWTLARRERALALYYLNPLVLIETAWSGHLDVIAFGSMAAALLVFERAQLARHPLRTAAAAGALLGASIAAKLLSLVALPLWLLDTRTSPKARAAALGAVALVVALLYAPYLGAGGGLFKGFGTYAAKWRSNDGPYRALVHVAEDRIERWAPPAMRPSPDQRVIVRIDRIAPVAEAVGFTRQWQGREVAATSFASNQAAETTAKLAVAWALGLLMLWCLIVARDPIWSALLLLSTLLWLAPTVHPWYVAWLVPLAALRPWRPALAASALVLIAYAAWWSSQQGGPWAVPTWLLAVEFGAVGLLALWPGRRVQAAP